MREGKGPQTEREADIIRFSNVESRLGRVRIA